MPPVLWSEFEDCTGCGACAQICGRGAIHMDVNEYGFSYPYIDASSCVECGRCVSICPVKKNTTLDEAPAECYALRHRSAEVVERSASGGAFTAILEAVQPDAVFGAAFDENWRVRHICAKTEEEIASLRGSKYVQSDTGTTFSEVKQLLREGKTVLYTGTPCQIAGLKAFLGRDDARLITCDLLCEGVQGQHFFNRYLERMKKKHGEIRSISFRDKEKGGWERSHFTMLFSSGKKYTRICHTKDSSYMNSMLFQGGNRDSCYTCPFAALPRQGDFTMGDLWGWREMVPEWNENKGISLLMCNTAKAKEYVQRLAEMSEIKAVTVEQASRNNPNVVRSTKAPSCRKTYMEDVKRLSFAELEKKWLKPRSLARRIVSGLLFWWKSRG